jgi:(2Fe-2S) ferredoxin
VSPCSHVDGHKYVGNLIIYGPNADGEVTGHWYGYVTPDDVPILLDQHIGKREIVDRLWRGQMDLTEEEQKQVHQERSYSMPDDIDEDELMGELDALEADMGSET